jgi:hypothetical protein
MDKCTGRTGISEHMVEGGYVGIVNGLGQFDSEVTPSSRSVNLFQPDIA